MPQCQFCAAALTFPGRVPLNGECPSCTRDVHCCRQCVHFDPRLNNQCRETQAEWVVDKDRRNFCDFFRLTDRPAGKKVAKEDPETKWKKMFKKEE